MKAVVDRASFLAAIQSAAVATAAKSPKPVLQSVKAAFGDSGATLEATDLEISLRLTLAGVRVEDPGACLLPAAKLISILREVEDDELLIDGGPDRVLVQGGLSEFELPGADPAEWPDVAASPDGDWREVDGGVLKTLIRRTAFAVAGADARFAATSGVQLQFADGKVRLVATDGRRLAVAEAPLAGEPVRGQTIVPVKPLHLLERHLADGEAVRVGVRANDAAFVAGALTVVTRLVEGRFPDHTRVVLKDPAATVPLTVGPFHAAVRQASILTDEESRRVVFAFRSGRLTLSARGSAGGRSKVELAIDYAGKPVEVGFDPKYIRELLKVLEPDESLELRLVDGSKPALLVNEAGDYQYVVTPLILKE